MQYRFTQTILHSLAEGIKEYVDGNVSVNLESYKKYENTVIAAVLDDLVSRNCRS